MTVNETINTVTPTAAPAAPAGYMQDAKGRLVPEHLVKPVELLEDQLVGKMMGYADDLNAQIARFKAHCFDDVGSFMSLLSEKYGAKRGGAKGNVTFTSFDGLTKVQVAVADHLSFGPELKIAKSLIDECIAEWSADANANIRVLVDHAFRVDKEGQVSREGIFTLRRLEIDDLRWRQAMAAIADSITIQGSKTYIRFYSRPRPEDRWQQVTIDLASA